MKNIFFQKRFIVLFLMEYIFSKPFTIVKIWIHNLARYVDRKIVVSYLLNFKKSQFLFINSIKILENCHGCY